MIADKDTLPATIRTERLTLRRPVPADAADLVAMANNANIFATTATLPFPYTETHARDFIARAAAGNTAYVIALANGPVVGVMSFMMAERPEPELGYWLGEPHWGRGYASEAAIGLLAAAQPLPGFANVIARVLQSNPASIRVLEKAGFTVIERTEGVVERHRGKPLLILRWSAK